MLPPSGHASKLYMPRKTKALVLGRYPDCGNGLEAIDTWQGACPNKDCGYPFDHHHWPWITAELSPEGEKGDVATDGSTE